MDFRLIRSSAKTSLAHGTGSAPIAKNHVFHSFPWFFRPGTLQNSIFRPEDSFAPIGSSGDRYRTDFMPILMVIQPESRASLTSQWPLRANSGGMAVSYTHLERHSESFPGR